jgi:hypothetical protein
MSDEIGHAFFCYLLEIDTTNFKPQSYPITQSKIDSTVKRLDNVYKFIKDNYILKENGIDRIKVGDLFKNYSDYCTKNQIYKPKHKIDFNKTLENINIKYKKINGIHYYEISLNELKKIATKFNWNHELDEIVNDDDFIDDDDDLISRRLDYFAPIITNNYEEMYKKMLAENELLKNKIDKMTKHKKLGVYDSDDDIILEPIINKKKTMKLKKLQNLGQLFEDVENAINKGNKTINKFEINQAIEFSNEIDDLYAMF